MSRKSYNDDIHHPISPGTRLPKVAALRQVRGDEEAVGELKRAAELDEMPWEMGADPWGNG